VTGRFDGRRVLVTGAARGLGAAIASRFLAEGARVALADLRGEALAGFQLTLGAQAGRTLAVVLDVRDPGAVAAGLDAAWEAFGGLDVLVNNAGVSPSHPVLELTLVDWRRVLDTNLTGTFLVSQAFARRLTAERRPGAIVNITSGSARRARRGTAHYSASKAGIEMLTRCFALELAEHRIRVNSVSPSHVAIPGKDTDSSEAYARAHAATRPWPRPGTPDDIAQAVLYLASDEAEWITGTTLRVDGGRAAGDYFLPIATEPPEQRAE
jgi:3-oxoacyl-[acyl-carrier protein] reductase